MRHWGALLLTALAACQGGPDAATAAPAQGWVEFGLVAPEEQLGEVQADAYRHWDSGGSWEVPSEPIWLLERPLLRCRVARLERSVDELGFPALGVTLQPDDARVFHAFSARAIGRQLAVLVEGRVVLAPTVADPLAGSFVLSGRFSDEDVDRLFAALSPR